MQKECKHLKECFVDLARCEQKLTSDLSSCRQVHEEESFRTLAEEYHSVSKQMGDCAKEFSEILQVRLNYFQFCVAFPLGYSLGLISCTDVSKQS